MKKRTPILTEPVAYDPLSGCRVRIGARILGTLCGRYAPAVSRTGRHTPQGSVPLYDLDMLTVGCRIGELGGIDMVDLCRVVLVVVELFGIGLDRIV